MIDNRMNKTAQIFNESMQEARNSLSYLTRQLDECIEDSNTVEERFTDIEERI